MKKLLFLAVILVFSAAAVSADPCEGYWKSIDEDGKVTAFWRIYTEGDMLFGEIVKIADKPDSTLSEDVDPTYPDFPVSGDLRQQRVIGIPWIYNMEQRREGHWRGGYIIDPEDGNRYRGEVIFHDSSSRRYDQDTLELKGRVLFFSRSQYWERSSLAEIEAHEH